MTDRATRLLVFLYGNAIIILLLRICDYVIPPSWVNLAFQLTAIVHAIMASIVFIKSIQNDEENKKTKEGNNEK